MSNHLDLQRYDGTILPSAMPTGASKEAFRGVVLRVGRVTKVH